MNFSTSVVWKTIAQNVTLVKATVGFSTAPVMGIEITIEKYIPTIEAKTPRTMSLKRVVFEFFPWRITMIYMNAANVSTKNT